MEPDQQLIETGRLSFWLSVGTSWLTWTALLTATALDLSTMEEFVREIISTLIAGGLMSVGVAAAGAIIGLACGSPLSRFYLLVFGAAVPGFVVPLTFLAALFWQSNIFTSKMRSLFTVFYVVWGASVVAGLIAALTLHRYRTGFGLASARACRSALVIGVPLVSLIFVLAAYARGAVMGEANWPMYLIFAPALTLSVAAVSAVFAADRPARKGFAVLHVDRLSESEP